MYQLLVDRRGWQPGEGRMMASRTLEYTDETLVVRFTPNNVLDTAQLLTLPALFVNEIGGGGSQYARIGQILSIEKDGAAFAIRYTWDGTFPAFENHRLEKIAAALGIEDPFEFRRVHWAIKDVDLFLALLRAQVSSHHLPKVFTVSQEIDESQVAVMMPFDAAFSPVYTAVQECAAALKLKCHRADDIWRYDAIIQDIVSLISRARIVVCDCTNRNPNVFYEAGIAHTLGRDVILITQSESDIPFNLRHLRFIKYLSNREGMKDLVARIKERMSTLLTPSPT